MAVTSANPWWGERHGEDFAFLFQVVGQGGLRCEVVGLKIRSQMMKD